MKAKFLVPLLIFVSIAVLLGWGLFQNPREIPSTLINQPAPGITLPDLYTGDTVTVEELSGQTWILNVWASWCASCKLEHPLFNQLASLNLAPIVGLNYKDEPDAAKRWLQQRGNPYAAVPVDASGFIGINWGVVAVPETFVVDPEGLVIFKHTGPLTSEIIETQILPRLGKKS